MPAAVFAATDAAAARARASSACIFCIGVLVLPLSPLLSLKSEFATGGGVSAVTALASAAACVAAAFVVAALIAAVMLLAAARSFFIFIAFAIQAAHHVLIFERSAGRCLQ